MLKVLKIFLLMFVLFTDPMLGIESTSSQSEGLAPPKPRLHTLSREDQVRSLYQVVARNLRAAGHELTLEVRDVTTIPREDFGLYKAHQVFTVGEGVALRVRPHTNSTDVEMPDETRREIDRFITFHLEWEPDYWLMNADPERAKLFEEIRNRSFAEYVEIGASEDEALQGVEGVTSIEVQLAYGNRERVYRAAAIWYEESTEERDFVLVDRVLLQLEDAFDVEHPVRPVSALDEVAEIPEELLEEIAEMRGETRNPELESSETQCKPFSKRFPVSDFKQGRTEHSGDGNHQSSVDVDFVCGCDQACTSSCSPVFDFVNCADFDPIAFGRKHVAAANQSTKPGTKPNAWDVGATCLAGYGCVFRSCLSGTPCGVSVSVEIAGGTVSFNSSGATYSLNTAPELQGGCPKCEVDTDNCVGLGDDTVCGSDPEPIPNPDCTEEPCSPIVIDLARNGFRFTGFDSWVAFDIDADGTVERITWTDPTEDEAFLVLDRNGNGRIDDGRELFGNATAQPESDEPNGFLALAVFDEAISGGNQDGVITQADEIFESLRLWRDDNHNAMSEPSELRTLHEAGIVGIQLSYITSKRRDRHRNTLRWTSFVQFTDRGHLAAADVVFVPVPAGID